MRFFRSSRAVASLNSTVIAVAAMTLVAFAAAPAAHAQAHLSFSGGSGAPLSLTIESPITYTLTASGGLTPFFVFDATGNFVGGTFPPVSGSVTYTINGGPAQTLAFLNSGATGGVITADDSYLEASAPQGISPGAVVVLTAGTLTTTSNFAGAAPAGGTFTTFIISGTGNRLSTNGGSAITAAPEPGTIALVAMGLMGSTAGMVTRRRHKAL